MNLTQTAIIVDIDGTLADKGERHPFDYSKVSQDTAKEAIKELVNTLYMSHYKIVIFSGREDVCYFETRKWLDDNGILFNELFMRKEKDRRKDSIVKKELYENHVKDRYDVLLVLDDRDQVVKMWREELGLTCLQVAYGDF